jgi:hypothetical protein
VFFRVHGTTLGRRTVGASIAIKQGVSTDARAGVRSAGRCGILTPWRSHFDVVASRGRVRWRVVHGRRDCGPKEDIA